MPRSFNVCVTFIEATRGESTSLSSIHWALPISCLVPYRPGPIPVAMAQCGLWLCVVAMVRDRSQTHGPWISRLVKNGLKVRITASGENNMCSITYNVMYSSREKTSAV